MNLSLPPDPSSDAPSANASGFASGLDSGLSSGVQIKFYNYHEYLKPEVNQEGHHLQGILNGDRTLVTDFPNIYNIDELHKMNQRVIRIPRCYSNEGSTSAISPVDLHLHLDADSDVDVDVTSICPQFSLYFPGQEPGALLADANDPMGVMSSQTILNGMVSSQELYSVVARVNGVLRQLFMPSWRIGLLNLVSYLTFWLYNPYDRYAASKLREIDQFLAQTNIEFKSRGLEFVHPLRSGFLSVSSSQSSS